NLKDSLQLTIAKEPNFDRTFALSVAELHLGAQPFAQTILDVTDVRITGSGEAPAFDGTILRLLCLQARDQFFGLPDAQVLLEHPFGRELLVNGRIQAQDHFRVPYREPPIPQ